MPINSHPKTAIPKEVVALHSLILPSTIRAMPEQPPVAQALSALQIPYTVFTHPGPVNSLEQAASERGQQPEQVVRSLLFRLGEGDFAMVLMAGPAQVSWKVLRKR